MPTTANIYVIFKSVLKILKHLLLVLVKIEVPDFNDVAILKAVKHAMDKELNLLEHL